MEVIWSDSNEEFLYDSLEELLRYQMYDVPDDLIGMTVWRGLKYDFDPLRSYRIEAFLETLSENTCDILGDCGLDFPKATSSEVKELDDYIKLWLNAHSGSFYEIKDVQKYLVTVEDIKLIFS